MGVEAATYISGLVSSNPAGTDDRQQGDDHLRLIKAVLLATLPNLSGAMTATHTQLNYMVGVTSAVQTQIDTKLASASYTAADVIAKMLTVDGSGSGLDADLLDGLNSTAFLKASNNLSDVTAATARTNLGLVIGTDVLAPTGSGTSLTGLCKTASNLSDVANAATALSNLSGVATSRSISVAGTGLSGGGTLAADRTITIDQTAMKCKNVTGKPGVSFTIQSGGSASGGSDGDIIGIY